MTEIVHGTRRDADDRLARIRSSVDEVYGGGPTVGSVWDRQYWPRASTIIRKNTADKYLCAWKKHVEPRWGSVPCSQVEAVDVRDWLSEMTKSTAEVCRIVLSVVMGEAVQRRTIPANPVRDVTGVTSRESKRKDATVWGSSELAMALEAMRGSFVEGAVILAAFGGCRVGESLSPKLAEIDFSDRDGVPVATCRLVRAVDKDGALTGLKTAASARTVVVVGGPAERLREVVGSAVACGDVWLSDDGEGNPSSQYALVREWHAKLERAGIKPIPFTNLRNSFATVQHWEAGVPLEKVSRLMGHTQISTTLGHYDRPDADDLIAAMAVSAR